MKIEEKIQMLFTQVIEKYDGNKKAAAESLGINPVTFWGWVKNGRGLTMIRPLLNAVERAGGILLIPGDKPAQSTNVSDLEDQVDSLKADLQREKEKNIGLQAQVDMLKSLFHDTFKNSALQGNDHANAQINEDKTGKAV